MARAAQAVVGGDYVQVGEAEEDRIAIDDRRMEDINREKVGDDRDEWDDGLGGNQRRQEERRESLLGGANDDGDQNRDRQDGDDDDEEDARLAYDDDGVAPPQERRGHRSRRNERRRAARDSRDAQIADLQQQLARNNEMMSGIVGGQFMTTAREIDTKIRHANAALTTAREELARAVKEGDGEAWAKLDAAKSEAERELWALQQQQARIQAQAREAFDDDGRLRVPQGQGGQGRTAPTPEDVAAKRQADHYSRIFQDRYDWFDPEGDSRDDRRVKRIDAAIFEMGLRPHQKEYWHEFEDRMRDAGFRPNSEPRDRRDEDDDDRGDQREERRGYSGGGPRGNRPPTANVRPAGPGNRNGSEKRLSATESDTLRQLGLLEEIGEAPIQLTEQQTKQRDRIVNSWMAARKPQR